MPPVIFASNSKVAGAIPSVAFEMIPAVRGSVIVGGGVGAASILISILSDVF